ncbi:MAG TPA: RNA polymerase sigma factor SigM [Sporichthya sp.]|nr:RNA polymerase sigma factor SigM [Sporichthya sp.]
MQDLTEVPDRILLERHREGDPNAFGEIVRRHRDRMWAVALRTLGDPEEAADAVQDALVSAYRAAEGFRGDSAITTWLHRIVVNACLDRARRKSIRKTVPLPDQETDEDKGGRDVAIAEDPTNDSDLSMDIAAALATLPPDQRAALVLVDLQGYPVDEAGRILGVPTGTVKSRCARGRARLVPLLAHLRQGADPPGGHSAQQGNENAPGRVEPEVKGKVVPLHRGAAKSTGGPPGQSGPAEGADRRT